MASSISKDVGGVWTKNTPLQYVAQVMRKLSDGTYPTVPTQCFCGDETPGTVLAERDRYTIPHRMVMCERCCLMRANPRMTEAAYRQFYANEYRQIYDGFPYGARADDDDYIFGLQLSKGCELKQFTEMLEVPTPKVVLDVGCDHGGTLMPFKEVGAEVWGTEWVERSRNYAQSRGVQAATDLDELIERGVKADLVIMQDIIEHFMDLHEMEKVSKVLNKGGYVFLYTPGFLTKRPEQHWQNAHTWQFIGATLEYVMTAQGYAMEFLDDRCVSLWRYHGTDLVYPTPPPLHWRTHIIEHLENQEKRTLPPIRTRCKFSAKEVLANLEINLARKLPTIQELRGQYKGSVVVVGGGPSVDGQVDKIRELQASGASLMVIERMYPWCFTQSIRPDFVVALDASDDVEDGFTHLQPGVDHLIVATIKPSVLDVLKNQKVHIWSGLAGSFVDAQEYWSKNGYDHVMIVNSGSTVVLGSIMLALILGFRDVHLLGFDCMVPNLETTYAKDIAGKGVDRTYFEVEIAEGGGTALTCPSYLAFAQQFFSMIETARKWGMIDSITVYGESLVNKMWDGDLTAVDKGLREAA